MHGGWAEASPLSTSPLILLYLVRLLKSGLVFCCCCFCFVFFFFLSNLFYWCDGSTGLTNVTVFIEQLSGVTTPTVGSAGVKHMLSVFCGKHFYLPSFVTDPGSRDLKHLLISS